MVASNFPKSRKYLGVAFIVITTFVYLALLPRIEVTVPGRLENIIIYQDGLEQSEIEEWVKLRNETPYMSKLGRILFLDEERPLFLNTKKTKYNILIWKYGPTIENRHLKQFSGKKINPFEYCSVKNCDITYSDDAIHTADIVIFHLHRFKNTKELPNTRNPKQIWAFLTDESPYHTFLNSKIKISDFNGIFNWSMTYRMDSDIPVPYGRTILKKDESSVEKILTKRRDVLVAILGSNCKGQNNRWKYVAELQKYIKVDVYGGCGPLKSCPGHFKADCPAIDKYMFYLSFENSNCNEYITEKLWWNAFKKNSIPIVMGANKLSYGKLLPVNSYINVEDFARPIDLAQFLYRLNQTGEFQQYFKWKQQFEVLNEHGYFQSRSYHYCRICEALNFNSRTPKTYNDLQKFWCIKTDCYPPWNS